MSPKRAWKNARLVPCDCARCWQGTRGSAEEQPRVRTMHGAPRPREIPARGRKVTHRCGSRSGGWGLRRRSSRGFWFLASEEGRRQGGGCPFIPPGAPPATLGFKYGPGTGRESSGRRVCHVGLRSWLSVYPFLRDVIFGFALACCRCPGAKEAHSTNRAVQFFPPNSQISGRRSAEKLLKIWGFKPHTGGCDPELTV